MSYRVATADKPYIARFLIEQREARGWTQDAAIAALVAADIGVKAGSYPTWETGARKPPPGVLERVAMFYGAEMPVKPPPVEPPKSETERLIEAIGELVEEMRLARERDQDAAAAILQAARALGGRPKQSATRVSKAPAAPLGASR